MEKKKLWFCFVCEHGSRETLTVQAHIVVGEDGRFVSFGCSPDHHMQHPIGSLHIMFLENTKNTQINQNI